MRRSYAWPVGLASWGVSAVWHVPYAARWKIAGILSRASFVSLLICLICTSCGAVGSGLGSGSASAVSVTVTPSFGAAFSGAYRAIQ